MDRLRYLLLLVCLAAWPAVHSLHAGEALHKTHHRNDLAKAHSKALFPLPEGLRSQLLASSNKRAFSYPLAHARGRREAGKERCGLSEDTVLEHNPQSLSETAEAIQALWVGRDEIVIVASDQTQVGTTSVWIGTLKAYGIFQFSLHSDVISGTVAPSSLQVSPAGNRNTVVVVSFSGQILYVSRDSGLHWDHYQLPSPDFDPTEDLHLSSRDPRHMVLLTRDKDLYVTDRWGEAWNKITGNVERAMFSVPLGSSKEYLFYSTSSSHSSFFPLYRMDITNRKTDVIDRAAFRFTIDGQFLFVSRQNETQEHDKPVNVTRRLYASTSFDSPDASDVSFTEVQLPSIKPEQFYVVMATHESGAFIHVAKDQSKPMGELYVSDSSGSQFSLSLPNHLYKLIDLGFIRYTVDDFYEVLSMRGVYITTQVVQGDVEGHVTMITFDEGGLWQKLRPPSDCPQSPCSLHLHLRFSQMVAPFYNSSSISGPLAVESAAGIIIAHGSLGAVRNHSESRLVLSRDGGYTWMLPSIPQGTFVYGIADYGNIIAVAPDTEHVEYIWFSHDRGNCFVQEQLDSTNVFALTRGLLMDPTAASLFAFVMGVEGTKDDDEWRMITVNFGSLLGRKCQPRDYQNVTEHVASSTCLMGYKSVYNITKTEAVCYNEDGYNYKPVATIRCDCTFTDYECDYGFVRKNRTACVKDPKFKLSAVCPPGTKTYTESQSGFRLIPGDRCSPTSESRRLLQQVERSCTGHEEDTGYSYKTDSHGGTGIVAAAVLVPIAVVVLAGISLFCYLKFRNRPLSHERVFYQKIPMTDSRFSATEDSESDEDLLNAS